MRVKRLGWLLVLAPAYCLGADKPLSPELLEFLGTGAQLGTRWIDPMSLRETPEPFAALTPAKKEGPKRGHPAQQPDAAPPQDESAAPHGGTRVDGVNEDD